MTGRADSPVPMTPEQALKQWYAVQNDRTASMTEKKAAELAYWCAIRKVTK